jgi:hypothetical protein
MLVDIVFRAVALSCAAALFFMGWLWFDLVSELAFNSDFFTSVIIVVGGGIGTFIWFMAFMSLLMFIAGKDES